jgi:hypothetical protein
MSADNLTQTPAQSPPDRIPRFVRNLNALAEQHGLAVRMAVEPYANDPELRLWATWSGSRAAFLNLVQPVASYHLPLSRGKLSIPGGGGYYCSNSLLTGTVTVAGDDIVFVIDFGPADFTLAEKRGVEIIRTAKEISYHGTADELVGAGIPRDRLPIGKRAAKSFIGYGSDEHWRSRRQPDGSILYRVESPAALRERRAEDDSRRRMYGESPNRPAAPALRLVVDNTEDRGSGGTVLH